MKTGFSRIAPMIVRGLLATVAASLLGACAATASPRSEHDAATPGASRRTTIAQAAAPAPRPASATGHSGSADAGASVDPLPDNELTPQILFQLLAAEVAAQRGQTGNATATYLVLARKTRDPRLARRATELALADRSPEQAMEAARLWHQFAPSSVLAAQTREMLLLSTNRFVEAEPLLTTRRQKALEHGSLPAFYRQLQRSLSRVPDKKGALSLLERIGAEDQQVPEKRLLAAELARASGEKDRAAAEALAAYALKPDDEKLALQAARFARDAAQGVTRAARLLREFLERHPQATEARFFYARLLSSMNDNLGARTQMERALESAPQNPAILFALAQIAYQGKQPDVAQEYLQRYLDLPDSVRRDDAPAYLFLAQLDEERGRTDAAIAWLAKITGGEQYLPALIRRSVLMARSGRIEQARVLLRDTLVSTRRERVQLIAAEAQLLREVGRPQDALDVLSAALEQSPDDPDLLYDHAMAAEQIDRIDMMEASLRKLIELRPDNAHAYNALGYSLADRNLRLDEAQSLIERALELSPKDAHILDSMGWVLFRRGQAQRAVEYLSQAYQLRPEAEIATHLGEVLWQLGRKEEARRLWNEAQQLAPDNELLRKTLARLNVTL